MLNVAVIGTGSMGKNHVRVYADIENVNLVALADSNKNIVQKLAKKYHVKAYTDYKKMLDKEKLDIVSIVVPTKMHKEVACYVIDKGINLLIEKPIAQTVADGKEIIRMAKEAGVKLMVGHIERFNPAIRELKKRLDNKEIGKVFKIDVNRVGPFPTRISDVGVVIDLAVHDLDIMRYLLGSEVKRIYAETEKKVHTQHEDLLSGLIRFKNGTICNLNINWLTPTKIRKLFITGERGMFMVNYLSQDLYFYENEEMNNNIDYADIMRGVSEGKMIKYYINKKEPLMAELQHFVECVEKNKKLITTGGDGVKALELAQKLIKSSKERRVILL